MRSSYQKAALVLVVALLAAGGVVAASLALEPDTAPATSNPAPEPEHGMDADAACQHMPEHCGGHA